MSDLGAALGAQGDRRRSRKLQEEALRRSRRVLGENHEVTMSVIERLCKTLREHGDLAGARRLGQEAVSICQGSFQYESARTLEAMDRLAEVLFLQGQPALARDIRERVVGGRIRLFGKEHMETLKAIANLAATAHLQGDNARSRELIGEFLPVMKRCLGSEHGIVLTTMDNLAAIEFAEGDLQAARNLQEEVASVFMRLRGDRDRDTLLARGNLAVTIAKQGDLTAARILQEDVLNKSRQAFGPEHYDTVRVKNNLAATLMSQGIGLPAGNRCVHCLEELQEETRDHVFPNSWYPDDTPSEVQRWTVPSCARCNGKLAQAEKDLMVTLAMCAAGSGQAVLGTSEIALRSMGIGTSGLSEKERAHRELYRQKMMSRIVPYGAVKEVIPRLRVASPNSETGDVPNDMDPVAIITVGLVAPVAEKIVRGLEFKLTDRFIAPPLALKSFIVPPEKLHVLDSVFDESTEFTFGQGLKALRSVPNDNQIIAMYRIIIGDFLTVDVAVGQFPSATPPSGS